VTPPQKKIHYGRIKVLTAQIAGLASALATLNVPPDSEIEMRMQLGREMKARIVSVDGIALGEVECGPNGPVAVTPLSPTA